MCSQPPWWWSAAQPAQGPGRWNECRRERGESDPAYRLGCDNYCGGHPPELGEPELRTHEGYEWLCVLPGELRLILAGHDVIMMSGDVAEFDTALPHWFGPGRDRPVEILSFLSQQGERMHVRAAPRRKNSGG